jgi:hypothetical protein
MNPAAIIDVSTVPTLINNSPGFLLFFIPGILKIRARSIPAPQADSKGQFCSNQMKIGGMDWFGDIQISHWQPLLEKIQAICLIVAFTT